MRESEHQSGGPAGSIVGRWGAALLAASSLAWSGAAQPPLTGPVFATGDTGAVAASGNQEDVDLAAGSGAYLAVWTDKRTAIAEFQGLDQSGLDVYAARFDFSGNVIDTVPMVLTMDPGAQEDPEVAWNGQNWLVVWEHETKAPDGVGAPVKIFGCRVASDGTVLDTPFEIYRAPGYAGDMIAMAVAANGSDWLVVGQADSGGPLDGVRVAGDGTILDTVPVPLAPEDYFLYYHTSLHVAQGEYLLVYEGEIDYEARRFTASLSPIAAPFSLPPGHPRIGSNGNEYYIAWDPRGPDLLGSRMAVDGTLLDPAGVPIMRSFWDPIQNTRVEWDGTVWWVLHSLPYPDGGIHLARVSTGGVVIDSPPVPVFDKANEDFVGPFQLEGNPTGGVQLVWADQDCNCRDEWSTRITPWDIHGKPVSASAVPGAESPIAMGEPGQIQPDLVAGPDHFLSVFRSEGDDLRRIVAQRLDSQGNAIDPEPIEIAASPWASKPAAAWNGSVYLIVWDEFYYCVGGDPPPCGPFIEGVRMQPDGTILDAQPIRIVQAEHSDVAALGDTFLVVGRDNYIYFEHEVIALGKRVDGPTGTVLDADPIEIGWSYAVQPRVAALENEWLVAYEKKATHDRTWGSSFFNFVNPDGTTRYDKFNVRVGCDGGAPDIGVSGANALITCREKPWGHNLAEIHGGLVQPDETSLRFPISLAAEEQRAPAVTWTGSEYLVTWEDKRNTIDFFDDRTDLYGAQVDLFGTVLDPDGFPITSGLNPSQHADLAWRGSDVLLASSIYRQPSSNFRLGVFHTPGKVNAARSVDFSASAATGCSPLDVQFTDLTEGVVTSWYWDFGDGTTSRERNPLHTYADAGTYDVFLTIDGPPGPGSQIKRGLITVDQGTQADFTASVTSGCAPLDVSFQNTSLGDQTSWMWQFGDDTTSNLQSPSHVYQYPGNYTVRMTTDGACGPDTKTRMEYIQIDRMCPIQDYALADQPVDGVVTGTFLDTHVDADPNNKQSIEEVTVAVPGGTTRQLEHRWRFQATGGTAGMTFYVNFYIYGDAGEAFHFEYSQDNVNFTHLLSISTAWSSEHWVPLPPDLQGTVWIRLIDGDRSTTDTRSDYTAVYGMAVETGVPVPYHPVPATMGLKFMSQDTMEWMPTAEATNYDVMRGNITDLLANGSIGDAQCNNDDHVGTTLTESSIPPAGTGYYFVIRGDAAALQAGTLDNVPGNTPPEGRDDEAGSAGGTTCGDIP